MKKAILFILSTLAVTISVAQQDTVGKPPVTRQYKEYKDQVTKDNSKEMIELKSRIPNIVYDLRYATTNNFVGRKMYPPKTNRTFMRKPAAVALQEVQHELNEKGLGLKIFDAYRPYSVTEKFWELIKDERYVANPAKGSGHNRGIAADLTVIYLKDGSEMKMGTGFDNFTDSAHHAFTQLPAEILQNRVMLKTIMEKHGFKAFDTEWWHYYLADGDRFEILDIPFKKFGK